MTNHIFEQQLIYATAHDDDKAWARFTRVCIELGFKIRVTGGAFRTHKIDGSKEDFEAILELIRE